MVPPQNPAIRSIIILPSQLSFHSPITTSNICPNSLEADANP